MSKEVFVTVYGDSCDDEYGYLRKGWDDLSKEQQDRFLEMNPEFDPGNIKNEFWEVDEEWVASLDEKYHSAYDMVSAMSLNDMPGSVSVEVDEEEVFSCDTSEMEIDDEYDENLEKFPYGIAYEGEGSGDYGYYFDLEDDEEFDPDKLKLYTVGEGKYLRGITYDGERYTDEVNGGTSNTNWYKWSVNFAKVVKE